jgi:hypothetical protein
VILNGVQVYNGKSIGGDGGAIYASVSGPDVAASLTFMNCGAMTLFESTAGNGGFFYLNNKLFTLDSTGCSWSNLYAALKGGLIYGGELSAFSLSSCNLNNITSGL